MTTTTRDVLIAARALIADERNWIKGESARVIEGRSCYCARGAVARANGEHWSKSVGRIDAHLSLWAAMPANFDTVPQFNDDPATTHADVLAMFDRAIEAC